MQVELDIGQRSAAAQLIFRGQLNKRNKEYIQLLLFEGERSSEQDTENGNKHAVAICKRLFSQQSYCTVHNQ